MTTLKKLQKKLTKMEGDRTSSNHNHNSSGSSSSRHDQGIHSRSKTPSMDSVYSAYPLKPGHSAGFDLVTASQHEKSAEDKIASTEKRVLELERQLQKMRQLLSEDTVDRARQLTVAHRPRHVDSDTTLGDAEMLSSCNEERRLPIRRNVS
jgi:hypothetical protein